MDEARRVLDRLERIEGLRERGAAPAQIVAELRALVQEGERWAEAERTGTRAARVALDALDERLAALDAVAEAVATETGREVVAGRRG